MYKMITTYNSRFCLYKSIEIQNLSGLFFSIHIYVYRKLYYIVRVESPNFGLYIRSCFPLSASIFCFLKKKAKGFPLLSGLGQLFSAEIPRNKRPKRALNRENLMLCCLSGIKSAGESTSKGCFLIIKEAERLKIR